METSRLNYLAYKVSLTPRYYSTVTSVLLNKCTVDMSRRRRNVLNMQPVMAGLSGRTVISGRNSVTATPEIEQSTHGTLNKPIPQPPIPASLPVPGSSKSPSFDDDSDSGSNTRRNTTVISDDTVRTWQTILQSDRRKCLPRSVVNPDRLSGPAVLPQVPPFVPPSSL